MGHMNGEERKNEGLMDRNWKKSMGRISIGWEIDKDNRQTTDNQAPGSGREKLGREITTEWS